MIGQHTAMLYFKLLHKHMRCKIRLVTLDCKGNPNVEINWVKALITDFAEVEHNGYAAGYLMAWHITVSK